MKRFKSKKKRNYFLIYLSIFLISIACTVTYIHKKNLIKSNTIVDYMINDNFGKFNENIKDVNFILKYALNIDLEKSKDVISKDDVSIGSNMSIGNKEDNPKPDENINSTLEKIVYIYNTHQEEKYKNTYLEEFNITPNVLLASKMLKEYLEDLGIGVIVEERNITEKLHSLNLKYSGSYKVSRIFMEDAYQKNPSLKYFIDLHRDSSSYEKTVTTIDSKDYAKLLFIVGLENKNYEPNLKLATKLKEKIIEYNSSLFRSIYKKSGSGVNGVYNQDFHPNTMLIEVGGQYNNINEVDNTLKVLAKILASYIKEDLNE